MRFISLNILQKRCSKLSALLLIIVITFCLILVFTTIFTFYTNNNIGYKLVKSIGMSGVTETSFELPLDELDDSLEDRIHSIDRQTTNEIDTHLTNSLPSVSSHLKISFNETDTRPWFLTNGTQRLSALEASKLALWPEESADPNDDRIVNQLMFIPINYNSSTAPLKSIYLNAIDNDWKLSLGRREFLRCPVSSCQLVPGTKSESADLIFFKANHYEVFLSERKSDQIWAKFEIESPENSVLRAPPHSINWTVTYRHDSEIPVPYYKFYPLEKNLIVNNKRNYATNKTGKVAWFVSNCMANNIRLQYAAELSKYIPVDIYGDCGTYECPRSDDSKCWDLLDRDYKFYLSFENSNCFDYITEKFWFNGLKHDVLPIVMGAHPSTYKRLAPPHSYIHVDDYESPKQLSEYLKLLDSKDELYNKYFEWKGTGHIKQIYMWCRICAMLHAPPRQKSYPDLANWWHSDNMCVPITWTNMTLNTNMTQNTI